MRTVLIFCTVILFIPLIVVGQNFPNYGVSAGDTFIYHLEKNSFSSVYQGQTYTGQNTFPNRDIKPGEDYSVVVDSLVVVQLHGRIISQGGTVVNATLGDYIMKINENSISYWLNSTIDSIQGLAFGNRTVDITVVNNTQRFGIAYFLNGTYNDISGYSDTTQVYHNETYSKSSGVLLVYNLYSYDLTNPISGGSTAVTTYMNYYLVSSQQTTTSKVKINGPSFEIIAISSLFYIWFKKVEA